jgi:hypothetical protein
MTTGKTWQMELLLGPEPHRDDRQDDEDDGQGDGELKQRLLHTAAGAVDCLLAAENAPQTPALNLEQDGQGEGNCDHDLRDTKVKLHVTPILTL